MRKGISIGAAALLALGFALLAGSGIEAADSPLVVEVQVAPQTILLGADQAEMVTVHAEIAYSLVNETAAMSLTLNGIPVQFTFADSRGDLVAKFLSTEVKDLFGDDAPPQAVLTLSGITESGQAFTGSDVVRITYWR